MANLFICGATGLAGLQLRRRLIGRAPEQCLAPDVLGEDDLRLLHARIPAIQDGQVAATAVQQRLRAADPPISGKLDVDMDVAEVGRLAGHDGEAVAERVG